MNKIIYAVILSKELFNLETATEWAKCKNYKTAIFRETPNSFQFIQQVILKGKVHKVLPDIKNKGVKYLCYFKEDELANLIL